MSDNNKKTAAVIGAGLGGLSAAISLAVKGFCVTVFEKNERVGGKLNILEKDGYKFDLGPSILTLPHYFKRLWNRAGCRMEDYVDLQTVYPHWRNFFTDGKTIDLHKDWKEMKKEFSKLSDPEAEKSFYKFLKYSAEQFDVIEKGYFEHGLDTKKDFIRFYDWRSLLKMDYLHSMHNQTRRKLKEPHLVDIFDYFIKYVGSSALNAPGFMNLMPTIQFRYDLWYVKGGMYKLAVALQELAELTGVKIHTDSEVVRIIKDQNTVHGLELKNGKDFKADIVVSNMEVIPAYKNLLNEDNEFLKDLSIFEPACSGLVLHLGTDRQFPQLAHHNFFYSKNQKEHFKSVFDKKEIPEDPTLYVVAPSRTDPGVCPQGCDNIKILPHIPHLNCEVRPSDEDYKALRNRVIDKMQNMGIKGLKESIVTEHMWTPEDIEKHYYSNAGSIYGVVSDKKKNFALKAPKQSTKYKNLFFAGGSVNPGGGMPMAVLCGQNAADLISQKFSI